MSFLAYWTGSHDDLSTSSCWVRGYISSPSPTVQSTPYKRTVERDSAVSGCFRPALRYVKTEILKLLKYEKCYKDGNLKVAKMRKKLQRRKSYQNMENVAKTVMLLKDRKCWKDGNFILKYEKCWKDGNLTHMRKMLQRPKYCSKTKNSEKTEILLKYGKFYEDGNFKVTKIRKMLQRRKYC